jgi:hypothetical protein
MRVHSLSSPKATPNEALKLFSISAANTVIYFFHSRSLTFRLLLFRKCAVVVDSNSPIDGCSLATSVIVRCGFCGNL